jgi:excinuclease ABC subunit C
MTKNIPTSASPGQKTIPAFSLPASGVKSLKDRYYGPYVDTGLLRSTLSIAKRIFPLRQRPQPLFKDRPCLNYDIGRCPGVCQQLISPEDYHRTVQRVVMVFQGRTTELVDILTQQMEKAAEELKFELAAQLRDQIQGARTADCPPKGGPAG